MVANNLACNTFGHCYFLEDGCEQYNTFDSNLGVNVQGVADLEEAPLQLLPTDSSPSVFWITNMNNTFTNNVAVGGKFGYWMSMPQKPTGLSAAKYANDTWMRPRCIPLLKFDSNVAHSSSVNGFHLDEFIGPDSAVENGGQYNPRTGPFDPAKPCESNPNFVRNISS